METAVKEEIQEPTIEEKVLAVPKRVDAILVFDDETLVQADNFLTEVKTIRKEVETHFNPDIDKAHKLHKSLLSKKKEVLAPLIAAETYLKPQISAYLAEQERKRKEEEERLRAEQAKRDEEARLAEAIEFEEAGEKDMAEEVLEEPAYVPPVSVAPSTPKIGASIRKQWVFEVEDKRRVPLQYLAVDEKKVGQVVRAMGKETNIPGIRVYEKSVVASGRR